MVKNILLGLSFLSLVSCTQVNSSGQKTVTKDGDTVADVDISVSKLDALTNLVEEEAKKDEKLIFKASGTEPGWTADFSNYKLRLILDYGKDSLIIEDAFDKINDESGFSYTKSVTEKGTEKAIVISVQNKPCTDAGSGNKADRTVLIKYNTSVYKGCGSFVK